MTVCRPNIPAATSAEIDRVVAAHLAARTLRFHRHDDLGSNAVICSPPDRCPLGSATNSYSAPRRRRGAAASSRRDPPTGHRHDIDHPVDLAGSCGLPQSAGTRDAGVLEDALGFRN